jgi:hypothetical protein
VDGSFPKINSPPVAVPNTCRTSPYVAVKFRFSVHRNDELVPSPVSFQSVMPGLKGMSFNSNVRLSTDSNRTASRVPSPVVPWNEIEFARVNGCGIKKPGSTKLKYTEKLIDASPPGADPEVVTGMAFNWLTAIWAKTWINMTGIEKLLRILDFL